MINVTKTFLPPLEEYSIYLQKIWEKKWVTNNGPLVRELEQELKDYLGLKRLYFVTSGTMALQIAIKALSLKGEVITTPFSYVATTSSILWEGCRPIFCDIEADSLTIDTNLIEQHITDNTTAILATHVYGIPCDIEKIEAIARKHNLKVIYDAAHCFGITYKGKSLYSYGDISIASFHATKLFHTVEGGAIMINGGELEEKVFLHRSFGHIEDEHYQLGINGKNSEFHAAMGLCNLKHIDNIILRRKELSEQYNAFFRNVPELVRPKIRDNTTYNYAYYPVIFPAEDKLLSIKTKLGEEDIFPRRYFYPSLNTLSYVSYNPCPVSEDIANRVLCLPLYYELSAEDIRRICTVIGKTLS